MDEYEDSGVAVSEQQVIDMWETFEAAEPDISTERLSAMVGDALGMDAYNVLMVVAGYWDKQNEKS